MPNLNGVQIEGGASNNTVGGLSAASGNTIAYNAEAGVDVAGDASVGNLINANRIFGNDPRGPELQRLVPVRRPRQPSRGSISPARSPSKPG